MTKTGVWNSQAFFVFFYNITQPKDEGEVEAQSLMFFKTEYDIY